MQTIDPRVNRLCTVTITASPTETAEGSGDARVDALIDQLLRDHPPSTTKPADFLGAQFDLGLAWVHFPEGQGGLGQ